MSRTPMLIFLGLFLGVHAARGQDADSSTVRQVGLQARECGLREGRRECFNATLTEKSSTITADRVIMEGNEIFLFEDRVRIVDEGDTLTADYVRYDRSARIGQAVGSVRLGDGDVVVLAPEGDYDTPAKRADFRSGVTLVDSASTLTSLTGSYWSDEHRAKFAGSVRLEQDSLRMAADSLVYLREVRFAEAWSDVVIQRLAGETLTWALGDHTVNDEESGRSVVRGDVLLLRVTGDSTSTDSLWIRAGSIDFTRSDSLETITAVDSVRIIGGDFAALADSVVYRIRGELRQTRFFGSPIAWFGSAQVQGDSLRVMGHGEGLDSLVVSGAARLALRDSSAAPMQQLKGRRMEGRFERDSLRTLTVFSNAEALYHMESSERPDAGAVKTSGDRVLLNLDGGKVTDIRIFEGVEGTYYPSSLVDENLRLEGVSWYPDRRPHAEPLRTRYFTSRCRISAEGCAPRPESR